MPELPRAGQRVPQDWQQQIQSYCRVAGRKGAEVVREALAQYLSQTDPEAIKGVIADLQDRLASVERKLAGIGS